VRFGADTKVFPAVVEVARSTIKAFKLLSDIKWICEDVQVLKWLGELVEMAVILQVNRRSSLCESLLFPCDLASASCCSAVEDPCDNSRQKVMRWTCRTVK
jgi:hypothetical protein